MECFDFLEAEDRPAGNYQCTTLHMVFDFKQDFRRKARPVAGGHLIDLLDNKVYSSNEKAEKVYDVAGPEFGEALIGKIVVIKKAMYRFATSCACFHDHLSNTLIAMDFKNI
eukprot:2001869-Ditylum_brightwellii.AAC.1